MSKKDKNKKGKITSIVCHHPTLGVMEFLIKGENKGKNENNIEEIEFISKVVNPN